MFGRCLLKTNFGERKGAILFQKRRHKKVLSGTRFIQNDSHSIHGSHWIQQCTPKGYYLMPNKFYNGLIKSSISCKAGKVKILGILYNSSQFRYTKNSTVIHFTPMFHFFPTWKRQKTSDFLTFSGAIEIQHWCKLSLRVQSY